MQLMINSIYAGVEGEGVRIGTDQIFVRFQGCGIGCRNCDSKDTWPFSEHGKRSLETVMAEIQRLSRKTIFWVSITGGDPLDSRHRDAVLSLLRALHGQGFKVNLEAAGNTIVPDIFHLSDYLSFDYKPPSTGVATEWKLILQLAQEYGEKFQIKSVAQDEHDVLFAHSAWKNIAHILGSPLPFPWSLTPAWEREKSFPQKRFQNILEVNRRLGSPFRVIGQQHKWIYGPERRDV